MGYMFTYNGTIISWRSIKQTMVQSWVKPKRTRHGHKSWETKFMDMLGENEIMWQMSWSKNQLKMQDGWSWKNLVLTCSWELWGKLYWFWSSTSQECNASNGLWIGVETNKIHSNKISYVGSLITVISKICKISKWSIAPFGNHFSISKSHCENVPKFEIGY